MTQARRFLNLITLPALAITACSTIPEVEETLGPAPEDAAYVDLISTQEIVSLEPAASADELAANEALEARAAALRRKAGALSNASP